MRQISTAFPAIDGGSPVRESFLDFSKPVITDDEKSAVMDVLESGWLTSGSKVKEFEKHFAEFMKSEFALAVNSCTSGLFLVLKAIGVEPGHEVITTPNTFPATANVIEHLGAKPVFCDINLSDGNIDVSKVPGLIRDETKAIIAVHYAGTPCNMNALKTISERSGIPIISDSAHAIETLYDGRSVADFSLASAYSFYATKNLTTGEGGMVVTNDKQLLSKMRILRLHGLSDDAEARYTQKGNHGYDLLEAGYKFNMPDILAALGLVQLRKIKQHHQRRQALYRCYHEQLESIAEIDMLEYDKTHVNAHHLFPILVDFNRLTCDKDHFMSAMKAEHIGISQHFLPLHLYRYYREKYNYKRGDFPFAEEFGDRVVSLPFNQYISETDIHDVVSALKKIIDHYRKI